MVGIIQEQHPDRARLFMQWKQMGWPILIDSLNLLEVAAVPITLAIDEHGVIRSGRLAVKAAEAIEETFLDQKYEKPRTVATSSRGAPDLETLRRAARTDTAEAWRDYANALVLWGGPDRLDQAIQAYGEALDLDPKHGFTHFRLGVAYRMRYDSPHRRAGDFQGAVDHWGQALDIDPNQYIWRRRIQQYGPRLTKPYPFYDWVPRAVEEVRARGETPVELAVEPSASEYAGPAREFEPSDMAKQKPDPQGRIIRDEGEFIEAETVVVPAAVAPGGSARAHVTFRPILEKKAHWNNEVDDLVFWIDPPAGLSVNARHVTVSRPPDVVSQETRTVEFEVRSSEDAKPGPVTIPTYALYYVCEDVKGACMYRRKDIEVRLSIRGRQD